MCHEREGHMECTDTSIGRLVSFHKNFEVAFFQTRMSCHVQILPFAGLCPKRSITCTTRLQKPSPGSSCRLIIHFARGHSRLPAITDWCISNTCQCFQLSENSVTVGKHWNTRRHTTSELQKLPSTGGKIVRACPLSSTFATWMKVALE